MYAIVNLSGIQVKIEEGKDVKVPFQDKKVGSKIKLENVMFFNDGKKTTIGSPYIKSLSFDAEIISHNKENKVLVYKKKRRKGYEKKRGHQQNYSMISINNFSTKKKTQTKKISKPKSKTVTKNKTK